ncbi:MAG: beta-lactamase family protein [Catenulispora sp.]|nr:beta-lactamase family protein [Catenulispora sp.]
MDDRDLTARIQRMLARHAMVGLSLAVVRRGRPVFFHAHGLSNVTSRVSVTPDTAFRIGSITKTFTAVAVLQLVEQGLVDLDAPADRYLRSYRLKARATDPRPTVRQLLTHTAGLPELVHPARAWLPVLGETVSPQAAVPPLARYYRGGPRLVTQPGKAFVYSNHGFATLGQLVEDVTGQSLPWYLRCEVFEPLGLTDTHIGPPGLPAVHRATGNTFHRGEPRPVADRPLVTLGGGAIDSTARDLARYLTALSEGGGNEHGTVLKPDTLSTMYAAQYRPDPRVPGIGLGFHRREIGGRLVVGHDGLMPGSHAQMMLAPDDGIGVVALTNGAHQAMMWLGTEVAELQR